jgi:FMN phosphatase YigB (HAD superfamily)
MKKNTLIIFDCFGVITSEIAPIWFNNRYQKDEAKALKEKYFGGADRGTKNISELVSDLSNGLNIPREIIIKEWKEIFSVNYELIEYIKVLKEKYYIALLSNAPEGLVESILDKYNLHNLFDRIFISSTYLMAKPDREFYELCIDSFEFVERIYMIDDNDKNLINLDLLGIKAIKFVSNEELFKTFKEENI